MPDPCRTVKRSVSVAKRMGYTEAQALGLVLSVCASVAEGTPTGGEFDLTWLAQVQEHARQHLQALWPAR